MARSWQWFTDNIGGSAFPGAGGIVQGYRQLLQGEAIQRVITMGSMQNQAVRQVSTQEVPYMPYIYQWNYELFVQYAYQTAETIAKRSGLCHAEYSAFGNGTYTVSRMSWDCGNKAFDADVTVRKTMQDSTASNGLHWVIQIQSLTGNYSAFQSPNAVWSGGIFIRTLRTAA